jgi:hypothetical protein
VINFIYHATISDLKNDTDIRPLLHGDILDLSELPSSISVRAGISGTPGSVVFDLNAAAGFQIDKKFAGPVRARAEGHARPHARQD